MAKLGPIDLTIRLPIYINVKDGATPLNPGWMLKMPKGGLNFGGFKGAKFLLIKAFSVGKHWIKWTFFSKYTLKSIK